MKSFMTYFQYHIRATLLRLPILTLLAILVTNTAVGGNLRPIGTVSYQYSRPAISALSILLLTLCVLLPVLELSGFKNRRNLDTLFVLPVSRLKIAIAHWLCGWIQLWFVFSASFLVALIRWIPYSDLFRLQYTLPMYFAFLGIGLIFYSAVMFVFEQANTVADGMVFLGLSIVVLALPVGAIAETFDIRKSADFVSQLVAFFPLFTLSEYFRDQMNDYRYDYAYHTQLNTAFYAALAVWCVVAIVALVAYLYTFSKKPTEKAGSISNSLYGYRTLLPLCGFSLYLMMGVIDEFWSVFFLCAMLVGYVVYRRSFRLKKSDWIILGIAAILCILGLIF